MIHSEICLQGKGHPWQVLPDPASQHHQRTRGARSGPKPQSSDNAGSPDCCGIPPQEQTRPGPTQTELCAQTHIILAPGGSCPAAPGLYYKSGDKLWVSADPLSPTATQTHPWHKGWQLYYPSPTYIPHGIPSLHLAGKMACLPTSSSGNDPSEVSH